MTTDTNDQSEPRPYHWFQGLSVQTLYNYLTEYGPERARLEVHQTKETMVFIVKSADGETLPVINDSHICPPFCG